MSHVFFNKEAQGGDMVKREAPHTVIGTQKILVVLSLPDEAALRAQRKAPSYVSAVKGTLTCFTPCY